MSSLQANSPAGASAAVRFRCWLLGEWTPLKIIIPVRKGEKNKAGLRSPVAGLKLSMEPVVKVEGWASQIVEDSSG